MAPTPQLPRLTRCRLAALRFLDQRWTHFLLIACLAVGAALVSRATSGAKVLDQMALDEYFRLRGERAPEEIATKLPQTRNIVMVELSHQIPRPVLARLLTQLRLAKVVACDIMFVDDDQELKPNEKPLYRQEIKRWRAQNLILARAIKKQGNVVLGTWPEEQKVAVTTVATGQMRLHGQYSLRRIWQKPPAILWQSARYHAHLSVIEDEQDRVVRRVPLFAQTPQRTPGLGLAIAAAALRMPPAKLNDLALRDGFLQWGKRRIAVDREGAMLIDYVGGRPSFEYPTNRIVYEQVFDAAPEDFKDSIVIIGEASNKSKEIIATPFGYMPGMQIHANIAATLLGAQGPPLMLPLWQTALVALFCSLLLVAPLLRLPLWGSFCIALMQIASLVFLGAWLFTKTHRVLPLSIPILAIVLTYNGIALYEYRRARETLGKFIGRAMVPRTLAIFTRLQLGGHVEEATAFFCDVRGFMGLTEHLKLDDLSDLVNEYTGTLVGVVEKYQGRAIDYQGDGVFVLFERSMTGDDHAHKAVQAALHFQEVFTAMREKWIAPDTAPIEIGIGIATGTMKIGIVGAADLMKLSALGDAVNVAARVQTLTRQCGYDVLLTEETYQYVRDRIPLADCGSHYVRGREQPVQVYGVGETAMAATGSTPGAAAVAHSTVARSIADEITSRELKISREH